MIAFSCPAFPQQNHGHLLLSGIYNKSGKPVEHAIFTVYSGERIIEIFETKEDGKFCFKLPLQKDYLCRIDKPGLVGTELQLSAFVPQNMGKEIIEYELNNIPATSRSEVENLHALDGLPFTIVYYDVSKGLFVQNREQLELYINSVRHAMKSDAQEN
ncbi:MAG: hypothetical protein ACE5DN_01775 [Flavobacteriales bacterium]